MYSTKTSQGSSLITLIGRTDRGQSSLSLKVTKKSKEIVQHPERMEDRSL